MTKIELIQQINLKSNFLCVGLDPDLDKIPKICFDFEDPVFTFCKEIISHTSDLAVAYKPNLAFFESLGPKGWYTLEKVLNEIPDNCFTIADAKRGDIGNTSRMYAKCFFEYFDFDAVTVAPYMGKDSIEPFLDFENKWVILLGLTSNEGSKDFEFLNTENGPLYKQVILKSASWFSSERLMFVVGATHPSLIQQVREWVPDYFFLVPGVGAQGGTIEEVCANGLNADHGLLINNGRNIIYASNHLDFGQAARKVCLSNIQEMKPYIKSNLL
ncbi:MAG: hypothetical protein RLZZ546_2835 [Bacteroidota bacterium]|jgi:orotidine-5'-phosphate decarboxylase